MCSIKSIERVSNLKFLQNHWASYNYASHLSQTVKKSFNKSALLPRFYAFKHTLKSPLHYNKNLFLRHSKRLYLLCYKRWISFYSTHKFAKRYDKIPNVGMSCECVCFNIMEDALSSVECYTLVRGETQGEICWLCWKDKENFNLKSLIETQDGKPQNFVLNQKLKFKFF